MNLNDLAQQAQNAEVANTEAVKDAEGKQVVIPANNPSAEEMQKLCENIKVNYNFKVDVKPIKFNFKKSVDPDTKIETTRQALELPIPVPSVEGIIAILETGGKQLELLMDAVEDVVIAAARNIITDDLSCSAANFPFDKISWEAISNLPKAQRRGGGIPKETWEAFVKDYIAVMPGVTGKSIEAVTNAAKILGNRLAQVKTNEPVLKLLVSQLAIYADNTPNLAEYAEVVEFLSNKAEAFLNLDEKELLANL